MPSIVAAVVQCGSVYNDTPATIAKMRDLAKKCKAENERVQLVVFPEAFIGGYPKYSTFGVSVGSRTIEGRQEYVQYHKNSISTSGPEMAQVEGIAKEVGLFIVTGFIEKEGGTLYCSVAFVSPDKGLVYSRRKLMPTAGERLIWGFGTDQDTKVVKALFDVSSSSSTSSKDAPSNGTTTTEDATSGKKEEIVLSSAICWENMMQKDFPDDHPVEDVGKRNPDEIMIRGGSCIVSPLGDILAGPLRGEEGILTAELDLDLIIAGKFDLDVVGHYSRPDLFKLISPPA